MILSVEGYERVPFPTSERAHVCSFSRRSSLTAERQPRERENGIASRRAYEIRGGGDIKVVPSSEARRYKWSQMLAEVACARRIIFHAAEPPAREKETERERERERASERFIGAPRTASGRCDRVGWEMSLSTRAGNRGKLLVEFRHDFRRRCIRRDLPPRPNRRESIRYPLEQASLIDVTSPSRSMDSPKGRSKIKHLSSPLPRVVLPRMGRGRDGRIQFNLRML